MHFARKLTKAIGQIHDALKQKFLIMIRLAIS